MPTNEATPRPELACDHKMKSTTVGALGTDFNVSWCRYDGAFRVRDSKWELPIEGIGSRVEMLEINVEYYKHKASGHDDLVKALRAVEFIERGPEAIEICPWCEGWGYHEDTCIRQLALATEGK